MRPRPASSSRSSTSTATTSRPPRANTSAIPAPIVPSPTTPTVAICTGCSLSHSLSVSPETGGVRLETAELVVVEHYAVDAALGREHPRLRLDLLRREHATDGPEKRIALEPFQIAGQLLDPVDLAAPLDLDRDMLPVGVPAEQ